MIWISCPVKIFGLYQVAERKAQPKIKLPVKITGSFIKRNVSEKPKRYFTARPIIGLTFP